MNPATTSDASKGDASWIDAATDAASTSASSASDAALDSGTRPVFDTGATSSEVPDGGGPPDLQCGDSTVPDAASQLEQCNNGVWHRNSDAECASRVPRTFSVDGLPHPSDGGATCTVDTDCVEHPHGFCKYVDYLPRHQLFCRYGCVTDDECGEGKACLCGSPVGECVPATCRTDAECEPGMLCAIWFDDIGIGCGQRPRLSCQTTADECATDADCPSGEYGRFCSGETGARKCAESSGAVCGRPFLVQGRERLAESVTGGDWCDAPLSLAASQLSAEQRQLLGNRWTEIALMEHASIAAFARFTLQLLHVGAPSELIEASQRAMLDETAHARACFTLASAFIGHAVSAGKLPVDHALDAMSLPELVRLVIREGCVGETVAALEATEAFAYAELPEIQQVLAKIKVDELQHAELAWQFVHWALAASDADVREAAAQEFAAVAAETHTLGVDAESFDTLPFGLVAARLRAQLRTAAIRDVVLPCGAAVLRSVSRVRVDVAHSRIKARNPSEMAACWRSDAAR